jgi:multidrug efflux pump subunit AcrB
LLKDFPIISSGKNSVPAFLGSLVDIEWIEAETAMARQDRSDIVYLDLFPAPGKEKTVHGLLGDLNEMYGVSRADESVFVRYRAALITTVVLVLILLYLVLGAQFESFLLPLILMLSVPFSLAGAGPALFLSGSSLDSGSVLGLVVLFGLAVNNGIVLYEISEEKIRQGTSSLTGLAAAVYSGARDRFRPVLITTLTTIVALLPLVISPLGNSQRSMASTMLGGIIVSGFFAFFVLPPVFIRFLERRIPCA